MCLPEMPALQAPEVLEGGRATAASDVYSFGMVRCGRECMLNADTHQCHAEPCDVRATATQHPFSIPPPHRCQVLFELLTWRLPWTLVEMSPFKARRRKGVLDAAAGPCH